MKSLSAKVAVVMVLAVCSFGLNCKRPSAESGSDLLHAESIHLLLDVMKMARDRNPGFSEWTSPLLKMNKALREKTLDSLSARNRSDSEFTALIDSLLSSSSYQLYYSKFGNVKPDDHRRMLLNLPFGWLPSPADISRTLFDICLNRDSVAAWVGNSVAAIDLDSVQNRALKWLPPGEYEMPPIYFIMDGNGDAFAHDGKVCFDLYSLVLGERPSSTRYSNLAEIEVGQVEVVLAHEFHHVYADPFYDEAAPLSFDWKKKWRWRLIRSMTSEGIAMHCNPPEGLRRTLKEDTAIVAFWFRELSNILTAMDKDEILEDSLRQWYRNSSHTTARGLLEQYLSQSYEGSELKRQLFNQVGARPTLIYTLGWWMVSHISRNGTDRQAVLDLLQDPANLFERYNRLAEKWPDSLKAPL